MDKDEEEKLQARDSGYHLACQYCTDHFIDMKCKLAHEKVCDHNEYRGHPSYEIGDSDFDGRHD